MGFYHQPLFTICVGSPVVASGFHAGWVGRRAVARYRDEVGSISGVVRLHA